MIEPIKEIVNQITENPIGWEQLETLIFEMKGMLDQETEISHDRLIQFSRLLDTLWEGEPYSSSDVHDLLVTLAFIFTVKESFVKHFFKEINLSVPPKKLKSGMHGYAYVAKKKWHNKRVRNDFRAVHEYNFKQFIKRMTEGEYSPETIESIRGELGFYNVFWIATSIIKDPDLIERLRDHYTTDFLNIQVRLLVFYRDSDFKTVMERPELITHQIDNVDFLKKQNQRLKKQVGKKKTEATLAKKELHAIQKETKKLKGAVHLIGKNAEQQIGDALTEIQNLKEEMDGLIEAFQLERQFYSEYIERLQRQMESITKNGASHSLTIPLDLNGDSIAVIGGCVEQHYREIVEKYGGVIEFVPFDHFKLIRGAVSRSKAVFFLSDIVQHKHFREALGASKDFDVPFIFVNTKGSSSFERELISFIQNQG